MKSNCWMTKMILTAAAILCVFGVAITAAAQTKPPAFAAQQGFDTAQAAADALIQAAGSFDVPALEGILGTDGKDLVASEDKVQDKSRAAAFAAKAQEKKTVAISAKNPRLAVLAVGLEQYPLPIPIVQRNGKWYFDTKQGREVILLRRIGANELDAITICRGYVDAQREYASTIHDDSGAYQYAQRIISTQGKQDGLVWRNPDGSLGGPVSEGIAKAIQQGYSSKAEPYHGYFFKILKGQGPAAPLGQLDFLVKDAMIGGFALVAAPAEYRVTGVKTFIVSHDGTVYQKDLGPNTLQAFKSMERYNPDKTWSRTKDEWPDEQVTPVLEEAKQ